KEEKPSETVSLEEKQPKPKNPMGNIIPDVGSMLQDDSPSIKEKDNSAEKTITEQNNADFSAEDLKQAWQSFSEFYLKEKPRLLQIFQTFSPDIKEFPEIEIELLNENQETEIKSIYHELLVYLKHKLSNSEIVMKITVNKEKTIRTEIPYTDEEKYRHLKKENPKIDDLKDQLNLFFD
ncbi:MAG: hypothetical protein DRP35_10180, partial [Candidatus Zixiibacteriota bacterium]